MIDKRRMLFSLVGSAVFLSIGAAAAQDDEAIRAARWQDLANEIFVAKPFHDGNGKISLDAPDRALDAALVPVSIRVQNPQEVKSLYLIIDDNPAPVAAHATYGPAGDPQSLKLRVRINEYTYMHAVEETTDGSLYETHRFIKASGGCSAPSGAYDEAALSQIGQMKLRLLSKPQTNEAHEAQLLIRHPNFNGMQKDSITQGYTPARFLKTIDISFKGEVVLHLESDISLAADPAIGFALKGEPHGKFAIEAKDSDAQVFKQDFDLGEGRS